MPDVHAYLLNSAQRYADRAKQPVVAWDCIGAHRWAERCLELADTVAGMSDDDALAYLKTVRATVAAKQDESDGWGFYAVFSALRELDILIDPIAGDRTGWVVLGTHGGLDDGKRSIRPGYRRMLGINHCVSSCGRERGETDEDWLIRRDAWLARYHPDIKVIRDHTAWSEGRVQYTHIVGSVAEVRGMRHVVERDLVEGTLFLKSNRHPNSVVVVDAGPLSRDDNVEFLARSVPEDGEESLPIGATVNIPGYGQCEIVA